MCAGEGEICSSTRYFKNLFPIHGTLHADASRSYSKGHERDSLFLPLKLKKITKHFHKYFDIYILRGKPFFTQVISGTRVEPKRCPQSARLLGSNKIESFLLKMKRINILMVYSLLQFKLIQFRLK